LRLVILFVVRIPRHQPLAIASLLATVMCVYGGSQGDALGGRESLAAPCEDRTGGEKTGDDLLVLLNKNGPNQLSSAWEPTDLVEIPNSIMMPNAEGLLRYGALLDLYSLIRAAEKKGVSLVVRSAYRSFETQCGTFRAKKKRHGLAKARRVSAEPGRSQHQLGTTVDLTSARLRYELTEGMARKREGRWLQRHAHKFGFVMSYPKGKEDLTGYQFEPWHYRYIGRRAAKRAWRQKQPLERYLKKCTNRPGSRRCPRAKMPNEPNKSWIGGRCAVDADCAAVGAFAFCLGAAEGYANGHCTVPCDGRCSDKSGRHAGTFCVATAIDDLCHAKCDFKLHPWGGCRNGYTCARRARPGSRRKAKVCVPKKEPAWAAR